ncbi:MAG TPA: hypothetical protein P5280_03085 [Cyclobacteriaceae bacterium]|nr:hypothetical protein [Cyclobacteriaceae bacterium]
MSELIPIITTTLGIRPELAGKIISGLMSGTYERVGGVIRDVGSKEVVAWLRDLPQTQPIDATVLSSLGPLLPLNVVTSVLNLSISVIGFGVVMKRLNTIEGQLQTISGILAGVNRKLDLSFYSNFRAALELARTAFSMREDTNRRISATQAINRFLEAEHHYLGMLDTELQAGSQAVSPFLNTLFLAYVSTARCYLELGETETAWRHFQEGEAALSSRVRQYYSSIVGVKPAIFLHPGLADSISLERLTRLLRHYDGSLNESSVFENLRKEIWETASRKPETWLRKLPASIWDHEVDGREKKAIGRRPRSGEEMLKQVLPRLPEAFAQVELAHESLGCIEGYGIESRYLLDHNIEYRAWQQIEIPATKQDDPIAVLLPKNSMLLAN